MSKTMLINVTHVEESRVAVVDDGILETYEVETLNREQLKGNIYNAVVENVHPSLEAAFLKLSGDLKGFLPLDEVNFHLLPSRSDSRRSGRIGQHLQPGQKIMAQVVREPFAGKPPTVSTYFSLPGRFMVLMPGVDSSGISRKIEASDQRDRLKKLLDELNLPEGFGTIVRTAGIGKTKGELQRDLRYLLRLWQSIQRGSTTQEFPGLVYREADIVIRTIRDHFSSDIKEVWVDSAETHEKALAFVRDVMPTRAKTLRLYSGDRPLFNKYNLEEQIETIYKRRVPLPSGGEIVIDGTEALTAIDVNSARSKRKGDAEETTVQTNVEAASEIARQLRLRDLGGLIVIDFIDMVSARNKKKVENALRAAMKGDKARHDITRISKLGLVEIARQRTRGAKMGAMYTTCPNCDGHGLIKNLEAAALSALRKLQTRISRADHGRVRLRLPPDVATWMLNRKRPELVHAEQTNRLSLEVVPDPTLLRHQMELETFAREKEIAPPEARVVGDRTAPPPPPDAEPAPAPTAEAATAESESPSPRRRRRRRRSSDPKPDAEAGKQGGEEPENVTADDPPPEADAGGDGEEKSGRPRRRRRRRRRSRSEESESPASSPAPEPETVPVGVRSDELMPAAAGGDSSGRRSGKRRGSRRRR